MKEEITIEFKRGNRSAVKAIPCEIVSPGGKPRPLSASELADQARMAAIEALRELNVA